MHLNYDTSSSVPSNDSHEVHNIPTVGYGVSDSTPQSQSIVNNMMYYQGLIKPQPTSSGSKRTLIPNIMGQAPPPPSPGGRSFAAALRNLAKQAGPPSTHSNDKEGIESQDRHQQESLKGRIPLPVCNKSQPDNQESKSSGLNTEPRSGFQPYKPDEQRTMVSTSTSAPPHFAIDPATYPYHPANLYSPHFQHAFRIEEQMYLERCGVPLFPPSPYHPHSSAHAGLYGFHHLQSPLVMSPTIVDRMKIEEDRLQRDRDMQEREKRDKAKQQQRVKNVHTLAADLSDYDADNKKELKTQSLKLSEKS